MRNTRNPAQTATDAALLHAGPPLRDYDKALECPCGCHPRVSDTHSGGTNCPCQQTPEEKAAARQNLLDLLSYAHAHDTREKDDNELAKAADELHVTQARIEVGGAPFVITGIVDGRAFYLRERHGTYRIVLAPETNPLADLWIERIDNEITIAKGSESDLYNGQQFSPGHALRVTVRAIRSYLTRQTCPHAHRHEHPYCPDCGAPQATYDPADPPKRA